MLLKEVRSGEPSKLGKGATHLVMPTYIIMAMSYCSPWLL